jgi:hypothetical protein
MIRPWLTAADFGVRDLTFLLVCCKMEIPNKERQMGMKKIKSEITAMVNEAYSEGYDEGYVAGGDDGYHEAFSDGVKEERERIETVIKMKLVWAMENNKGSEIIFWKNALELLIDLPRNFTNGLTEDQLRVDLEEYGF